MALVDEIKELIEKIPGWSYDKQSGKAENASGASINVLVRSISTDAHRGADAAQIKIRMTDAECDQILESQVTAEKAFILSITPNTDSGKYDCGGSEAERLVLSIEGMTESRKALSVRPAIIGARDYFKEHPNEMIYRYFPEKGSGIPVGAMTVIRAYSSISALESYLKNFDNRPCRKVVYSDIDYISVGSSGGGNEMAKAKYPHNWLISGAPGTGKSYGLDQAVVELLCNRTEKEIIAELISKDTSSDTPEQKKKSAKKRLMHELSKNIRRVTFYEDYGYENFIGCYKPLPVENDVTTIEFDGKNGNMTGDRITYTYEPGPMTDILIEASNHKEEKYCLIIEEINRAKAASVFGDFFQLLDRDGGESVYSIVPEPSLHKYLSEKIDDYKGELRLPPNLFIWATMNSADQGVYPLDSAFKRRWSYCCKDVFAPREGEDIETEITFFFEGKLQRAFWDNFRKLINMKIAEIAEEDKFLGPWYFTDDELRQINRCQKAIIDKTNDETTNPLVEKLFLYLRNDVFRNDPDQMFINGKSISTIMHEFSNCEGKLPSLETVLTIDPEQLKGVIISDSDSDTDTETQQ